MVIRVERGNPSAEELAALAAVLMASPAPQRAGSPVPSDWRLSGLPAALPAARGLDANAWRASGLPH